MCVEKSSVSAKWSVSKKLERGLVVEPPESRLGRKKSSANKPVWEERLSPRSSRLEV